MEWHNYHFILDQGTIEILMRIYSKKSQAKLSSVLEQIIEDFIDRVKRFHFLGKDQEWEYKLIHPVKEIPRKEMRIRIKKENYEQLKRIRKEMNFFSIAQVIRGVIVEYIWAEIKGTEQACPRTDWRVCNFLYGQRQFFQQLEKKQTFSPWKLKEFLII